ncbi:MAG TPA: hypothetical protein VNV36_09870 [Pseudomonas sp.]|uniref:hypothetical protein n=1 Tax=Pseudomonas sp. TaxID=306 RepID=UPI002CDC62C0|nr:hypothetical protein [Pseudomonas sp.]HWH87070.1 hypothetical protein [Pseudomonas sp.]
MNTLYTFDSRRSVLGYVLLLGVMGAMGVAIGDIAYARGLPGMLTVGVYTLLNLLCGYCFFIFVLLRGRAP